MSSGEAKYNYQYSLSNNLGLVSVFKKADDYIGAAKERYASSLGYWGIFNEIKLDIESIESMQYGFFSGIMQSSGFYLNSPTHRVLYANEWYELALYKVSNREAGYSNIIEHIAMQLLNETYYYNGEYNRGSSASVFKSLSSQIASNLSAVLNVEWTPNKFKIDRDSPYIDIWRLIYRKKTNYDVCLDDAKNAQDDGNLVARAEAQAREYLTALEGWQTIMVESQQAEIDTVIAEMSELVGNDWTPELQPSS